MKSKPVLIIFLLLAIFLSACGAQNQNKDIAIAVALTQTAAVPAIVETITPSEVPAASTTGLIQGSVHLAAPPTPAMVVYALDFVNNIWTSVETAAVDGEAAFELTVEPGSYVVFAFSADDDLAYAGYPNAGGTDLGTVVIAAGQTVSGINVQPPTQSDCGSMWGVPPSPDGRFPSFSASEACLNASASGSYQPVTQEVCTALQEIAESVLQVSFSMESTSPFSDSINAESGSGCLLTASETADRLNFPNGITETLKTAFTGWEEDMMYQASGPTGNAIGLKRDMALMLISSKWQPAAGITCPADQPIGDCELTPAQKIYTIKILTAMK